MAGSRVKLRERLLVAKASVSVCIIAKNSSKTIAACLDSIVPYVEEVLVCVDALTNDNTAEIAVEHGAKVIEGLAVSEEHQCPTHGKVLAQHFAKARQLSFDWARPDTEWLMWLDADDVVAGGEKLETILEKCGSEVEGIWLDYHYSKTPSGATATLFQRERLVRRGAGWAWKHRVHEVIEPTDKRPEQVNWATTKDMSVVHQHQGHDTSGSARRNILLLEIDLEEDPNDMRALFYMANQYFALGEWSTAEHYYMRSLRANNDYQCWQALIYVSMCREKLGNMAGMAEAAHQAMNIIPYHPEPYLRLAVHAMYRNDVQSCEFWTKQAEDKPDPPFFVFRNPLDRNYNAYLTLGQLYANNGYVSRAKVMFEKAAAISPEPNVVGGADRYRKMETESDLAESYAKLLRAGIITASTIYSANIDGLWKFGRIRDLIVPTILASRPNTQPRIIFFCGRSVEPWAPPSIDTTGIGGSETAVIQIAKRFAADGWRVDVYNEPDAYEGVYEDVGYWGLSRLGTDESADCLVSWRNPQAYPLGISQRVSLLWCHDLNRGPDAAADQARWDKVLGVSCWHADYLSQVYGLTNVDFVPNGIDLTRFPPPTRKIPWQCVYASSPDRGLRTLLGLWPHFIEAEPKATLHIAYGWETIDKSIAAGFDPQGQLQTLKQDIEQHLNQPGVTWVGRLPQDELAKLFNGSYLWLYPTTFTEVSCITAMEAMAGGCVPVTSAAGALPETIDSAGLVVTGNAYTAAWKEYWFTIAKAALLSPTVRRPLERAGRERAKLLSWDASYEKWKELLVPMLEGKKEAMGVAT